MVGNNVNHCALPGHASAGFPPGGQDSVSPDPASGLHWPVVAPPLSPQPEKASLLPSHWPHVDPGPDFLSPLQIQHHINLSYLHSVPYLTA